MRAQVVSAVLMLGLAPACAEPRFEGADADVLHEEPEPDASTREEASAAPVQSDPSCIDQPSVLGAECPNVVLCTNIGPCDQSEKICCLTALSADCSARSDCGVEQRARCDGPEDCRQGSVCCVQDGATLCSDPGSCPESQRACHSNQDCETKQCARGWPGTFGGLPVTYFADWGFCRS